MPAKVTSPPQKKGADRQQGTWPDRRAAEPFFQGSAPGSSLADLRSRSQRFQVQTRWQGSRGLAAGRMPKGPWGHCAAIAEACALRPARKRCRLSLCSPASFEQNLRHQSLGGVGQVGDLKSLVSRKRPQPPSRWAAINVYAQTPCSITQPVAGYGRHRAKACLHFKCHRALRAPSVAISSGDQAWSLITPGNNIECAC